MKIRCNNCFQEYDEAMGMCPHCGYIDGEDYAEAYSLMPGTRILDRYVIGETLGIGGFGITYRAWDMQLGTMLAIKEYFPSGMVNRVAGKPDVILMDTKRTQEFERGRKRFLYEARNMAKFSQHHNIVNVFNFFEKNNTAYIVMEYLDGLTLSETLYHTNETMTSDRCVSISIDLCDALESIHAEKILHRDVSPDNIMLCRDGTVKLFDFGAARFSLNAEEDILLDVVVKPGFTPPEQYDSVSHQDQQTDIYALGATLYYALTGIRPEESTSRKEDDSLLPPQQIVPEIPEYVNNAVMRAMAIDPQYRFESVDEFRKVLREKIKIASVAKERQRRCVKRTVSICAAFLCVAVGLAAFWLQWNRQQQRSTLPDGAVEVWYMTQGDEDADLAEENAWKLVAEQFMAEYANVTVAVCGIPQSEYAEKISKAKESGTMPDIFESTLLEQDTLSDSATLTSLLSGSSGTVYLDALGDQRNQYPTGLIVPVIYVNTSMGTVRESEDIAQMIASCEDFGSSLLVDQQMLGSYEELYGSLAAKQADKDALSKFLSGKCMMYLGSSSDYLAVQEGLMGSGNGTYMILLPDVGAAAYDYGCLWSCNQTDESTQRIANALLEYLNSDLVQDHFNIRGFAQNNNIPATRSALAQFVESYVELDTIGAYLELPYVD